MDAPYAAPQKLEEMLILRRSRSTNPEFETALSGTKPRYRSLSRVFNFRIFLAHDGRFCFHSRDFSHRGVTQTPWCQCTIACPDKFWSKNEILVDTMRLKWYTPTKYYWLCESSKKLDIHSISSVFMELSMSLIGILEIVDFWFLRKTFSLLSLICLVTSRIDSVLPGLIQCS